MRKSLLTLVILFALGSPALAQNSPWAQKIFNGVNSHDFGTCPRGAKLKHRFRMKNIYAVPLQITNIRSSCGCLTFEAPKRTLQPQEEGFLDVVMDAARFQGPKSLTLYVTVGPEFVSTAAIQITANARADVVFNPGEVNFGIVPVGATPTQLIDVEYAGPMDWHIVQAVKNKDAPFDVNVQQAYRNTGRLFRTGKVGYKLLVTLKPVAQPGPFRQDIILKTNDPASPVLTVCVEGNVQAALTVRPEIATMGVLKLGQTAKQKIVVRGNRPFRVVGIDGIGAGIRADIPATISPYHVIDITCQPNQTGKLMRELRIRTDLNGGESVSINVQANVNN